MRIGARRNIREINSIQRVRMQCFIAAGLSIALAIVPDVVSASDTYIYGNVSGWTVRTDPAYEYRCFAEVQYEGGTLIRLGFNNADALLYIVVADPNWGDITEDALQSAQLAFDDEPSSELYNGGEPGSFAGAIWGIRFSIPSETRESFVKDFMQRDSIRVTVANIEPLKLSLAGSYRANQLLEECQNSMARRVRTSD